MARSSEGFEGESTDFDVSQHDAPIRIVPERGMVLLFRHGLRHQGAPVVVTQRAARARGPR